MKDGAPNLRFFSMTGVIGCKCQTCGWSATTPYVRGETADQTVRREFSGHSCRPVKVTEAAEECVHVL